MTPSAIVKHLDQYVVGQDEAKKILAVAVYSHYKKIGKAKRDAVEMAKSNILLVGSTGTGKTLLCETLARALQVPFVTADATSLAQTEFVNEEIDAILQRLLEKADGDVARAQCGIVFIDEVDKLKAVSGQARGASGERVQHALLKIMEGSPVRLKHGQYVDTGNILFICGGAFVGLRGIQAKVAARAHVPGFIERGVLSVMQHLYTDLSPAELFRLAQAVAHVDRSKITTCVVQGGIGNIGGASVVLPSVAQARRLGNEARNDATIERC